MSRLDVTSKVIVYEINGQEVQDYASVKMEVCNHWNESNKVVVKIGNKEYTVVGADLITAVQNAQRAH